MAHDQIRTLFGDSGCSTWAAQLFNVEPAPGRADIDRRGQGAWRSYESHPVRETGSAMPSHLLAILHSLPPGSGTRTLQRVDIAQRVLGCATSAIANVYPAVLPNTKALSGELSMKVFDEGRALIRRELDREETSDVLLAYGVQLPTGSSRDVFRAQLDWVAAELEDRQLRVWLFGGRPSHPSRWHRLVSRERPGSTVEASAAEFLVQHHPERSVGAASHELV